MSDVDQELNPYAPPKQGDEQNTRYSFVVIVLFVACIAMALVSLAVAGHAIVKILDTMPFMGIPVDASGNRIPVQGYPQLAVGLLSLLFFSVLAVALAASRVGRHARLPKNHQP